MDRFEIAIHFKNQRINRKAFHFPTTRYAAVAVKYIEYCITNEGIFIADNILESALESALIQASEIYDVPIVMDGASKANIFSISHSYKVYSLENIPTRNKYVLCYNCLETDLPSEYNVIGIVFNNRDKFKLI